MSQPPPPLSPPSQRPPPIPPQAINYPPPPARNADRDDYQRVADTVGMVPSLRWKDNLIQGISIVAGVAIGAGIGALIAREAIVGAFVGGIIGLVAALFISGIMLMILGMVRAKRRH